MNLTKTTNRSAEKSKSCEVSLVGMLSNVWGKDAWKLKPNQRLKCMLLVL